MTQMATEIETVVDDLTAHEFEPCCDATYWAGRTHLPGFDCERPARWIMHRTPCCPKGVGHSLRCDPCKESALAGTAQFACPFCLTIFDPPSTAYTYVEPIRGKS